MTEREKTVPYLQCDGCGYTVSPKEDHLILTTKRKGEEAIDRHFHYPQQQDENRSWGSSDCLGYWYMNRAARELSMDKHNGASAVIRAEHLARTTARALK